MKRPRLWINALVLSSCLLLGSGQTTIYGAEQNTAQASTDPGTAQAPADPNTAQASADPNAAQAPADPNAAQAPTDPNAAETPKDPNAPPDSYNWEVQSDAIPGWPTGPQVAA